MRLVVEWGKPIPLRSGARDGLIYAVDLEKLEKSAGVYVFARKWGSSFEALFVGKADNVRRRVRGQLNNLRLMRHLETARNGRRVVVPGYAIARPGQQRPNVLAALERALIRYFLSEGDDLVNKQGVRIRRHEIESSGAPRELLPGLMYLERGRRD